MNNIYQSQARYYANLSILNRHVIASVHLEDVDDILFWDTMLQRAKPGNYQYVTYSKSRKGNSTSGCEQCLKYSPYLSKYFFVCIDSDTRYLRQQSNIDARHFIAQTYTYSWENHLCQWSHLQERYERRGGNRFHFSIFLRNLSHALYHPWLLLLFNLKHQATSLGFPEFNSCIPVQCTAAEIQNNGEGIVKKISFQFEPFLNEANAQGVDLLSEEAHYSILGLNIDTAYLYVRGHNIYDLVRYIGERTLNTYPYTFKQQVLDVVPPSDYDEIRKIESDLRSILY